MSEPANWLQEHANWPAVFDFFSDVGGPVGWWVLLQLAILLLGTRRGLRFAWMVSITAYANTLLKWVWAEPRPYWISDSITGLRATGGFGMPSGHAQGAMAVWLGLWIVLRDSVRTGLGRWALLATIVLFIAFTGLSRIFYGVHSVAQVLVGFGLGALITLLLAWQLPTLEAWLRRLSLQARVLISLGALGFAWLVGWLTYSWRADFVAPADWVARFAATQARTGQTGDMGLVSAQSLVLVAFIAGYALLALLASERGHRLTVGVRAKVLCVLAAIVVNVAALAGLQALGAQQTLVVCWLLLQPLLALWLPLWFLGVPDHTT